MKNLLRKPDRNWGMVHGISSANANWKYVGFSLFRLKEGKSISDFNATEETIIVIIEGKIDLIVDKNKFGELGKRMDVFEKLPPNSVYVPNNLAWSCRATTNCTLAVCQAPGSGKHDARILDTPTMTIRGLGTNTRYIYNIAMEEDDVADSLLVTEVFTPSGNWSSYPPHRHDENNFPEITYLEETYYHRVNPSDGFAIQKVWTENGEIDETLSVKNHDVVLVPKGHHPCGVPYGYELYYLNVMAGPVRKWRFKNHPDYDWIFQRDKIESPNG